MNVIGLALIIFTDIILYLIIFDIILSWLTLLGLRFRPAFLIAIIEPIYGTIAKYIPTKFGMFRFEALIAILIIYFIQGLLVMSIPGLSEEILRLTNSL